MNRRFNSIVASGSLSKDSEGATITNFSGDGGPLLTRNNFRTVH
jgi:hypothetical protein